MHADDFTKAVILREEMMLLTLNLLGFIVVVISGKPIYIFNQLV
jgi:hypothetical protein